MRSCTNAKKNKLKYYYYALFVNKLIVRIDILQGCTKLWPDSSLSRSTQENKINLLIMS